MLSDESSSDSETGRFKCRTKSQDDQHNSKKTEDRPPIRSRPNESERFNRELGRSRDDRNRFDRFRDRNRFSRNSPNRRRYSRDKSPGRSHDRNRPDRRSDSRSKPRERSSSRDRRRNSRPRTHQNRSPEHKRDVKEESRRNIIAKEPSVDRSQTKSKEKVSVSPEHRVKRSEVYKPPIEEIKKKGDSPILVEEHSSESEVVQPGSYYSMIPAVIKEKSEESSEIDSSDDEKLRAKLLNLERELHKTKKKKHKKKHRKKHSKSTEREQDTPPVVEVSSTTDIQNDIKCDQPINLSDTVEVSSTQKSVQKESEEGEILSDDDSQNQYEIDANDLRHKLKRSIKSDPKKNICGPALPPHLETQHRESECPITEGPALPPHLETNPRRNLGPSIPEDMRKALAENDREVIKFESSDEDDGIGPLPAGSKEKLSEAHQKLEERVLEMKIRKLDGHSLQNQAMKSREQWMLELPEGKAKYLGLEARSFRAKEGPDMSDRSSWTDTPEDKARKAAGIPKEEDVDATFRKEVAAHHIATRDQEQEEAIKKHKKKHKRDESLLDMHEKKLKKKKKKEERDDGKKERRPFSRDVDLQVNRFDEAQKRNIIKKAQNLDSRFSRGEAKYL